ncbi:MAG: type II toxin-antitoxin system VapC family toxin [Proteobacteria bacterium]|nr:type II toxin-antitoxin system VapC family toxin [Pseudomonadota bacterium]
MPRYYLDTNICVYAWHRQDMRVLTRMRAVDHDSLVISALVAAELASGVMHSARVEHNRAMLERALALHHVEPWGAEAIWLYGQHWARLRQAGTPIGAIDLLIGCQVLADPDGVLVTHNVGEFKRIDGLRIEDWTAA